MVYLDTSALLKRYVPESNSSAFDDYLAALVPAAVSRLTLVELRSALARKRRDGAIAADREQAAVTEVRIDIQDGLLHVLPGTDQHWVDAGHLIERLAELPLRTLDALHLATAQASGADELATADQTMARAATALGLRVAFFGTLLSKPTS
ncbi:MAG: type II toxin-antitoxin system VapC family toxin [Rhodocyclaceae bacterium]